MKVLNLGYFKISTYILIIGIAFLISFIVFYKISKKNYIKLDTIYIYVINIVGFAIGSKLMSLISNNIEMTIYNFINSGYSFLGGILGSILVVVMYCKKYKLNFIDILSNFIVRFFEDYFREFRNIIIFNFTLEQIICAILLITSFIIIIFRMYKKIDYRYNRATLK